ncbi:Kti11 protein [Saccharomycopsis crataegensis]|uniref:Diphthamide biosynthesis protein 3 n=1 Tax=Saccharomycopsis crataegensis TaxID=43959 RepID=A0AAV5QMS4_9ASCO|nr:Kti11 protein [Saccharomycopsis crataegensis]
MSSAIYDQVEIEDFTFDPDTQLFSYPCPCGDKFQILLDDLQDGEDIAVCPTCSLMVQVIFDQDDLEEYSQNIDQSANEAAIVV